MHSKKWFSCLIVGVWLGLASWVSCDRDPEPDVTEEVELTCPQRVDEAEPITCQFTAASRSLVSLNIEGDDGDCSVVLPADVSAGELGVSISVAGRSDVASVSFRAGEEGFHYANEGTVTVEEVSASTVRGRFIVCDSTPPYEGGPFTGEFNIALE